MDSAKGSLDNDKFSLEKGSLPLDKGSLPLDLYKDSLALEKTTLMDMDIHYVHVDSKNRDLSIFPHGNSYVLYFTTPVKGVVKVDLVSARVPNSQYNLTNGSNVFSTTNTPGGVSLTPGFYSAETLVNEINTRLDTDIEQFYYSCHEGKMYYLVYSSSPSTLTVNSSEFARLTGFNIDEYTTADLDVVVNDFSAYGVKSVRIVDFSLNEYVFLDIEEFRGPFFSDLSNLNSVNAQNMFAVIPMDVYSGQIKTFKETSDYIMTQNLSNHMVNLSKLTIHWYDKNLKHVNFQGFENNGFVLRLYTQRVVTIQQKKSATDEIYRKIDQQKQQIAELTKKEEKKTVKFGKWTLIVGILGIIIFWYFTKRTV